MVPSPVPIPSELLDRPFTTSEARTWAISATVLQGRRFRQLFRGVWVTADHEMTDVDWIKAAALAMPERAQTSHVTRIQQLGLDHGSLRPFHFTVQSDLHLAVPDVFLHRTEVMPPTDEVGVIPAAAFIGFCASARVIDAIIVGDWLLNNEHMTLLELRELGVRDRWRPGAAAALWASGHLNQRSRSPKESELRPLFSFAGLPEPEVNAPLSDELDSPIGDLLWRRWMVVMEFEGKQHFHDPGQVRRDIGRYAWMRARTYAYLQVTNEMLSRPRAVVLGGHKLLVQHGYDGPPPNFGPRWQSLFGSCARAGAAAFQSRPRREVG